MTQTDDNAAHLLKEALLHQQKGELEKAKALCVKYLQLHPKVAKAHVILANLLYRQGELNEARSHYSTALLFNPDFSEARFNLGTLLVLQKDYKGAMAQFLHVIKLAPEMPNAHFQLGYVYQELGHDEEAKEAYRTALLYHPHHVEASNNLGAIYLKAGDYPAAVHCFAAALHIDENHIPARNNLAATLMQQDRYQEAARHYEELIRLTPDDPEANYNLGVAFMMLGNLGEAEKYLQKVTVLQPDYVNAYSNLGAIALKRAAREDALKYYLQASKLSPDDEIINYCIAALTQKNPPSQAPIEYVRNLFDNYAGYFDRHVTKMLHYQTPNLLRKLIEKSRRLENASWDILDIGCGTGLSGAAFRDIAKTLVGVDVAPLMIEEARKKEIYDELVVGDLLSVLASFSAKFDLIIAADVFTYFGELAEIFKACMQTLRPGGFFLFSVEASDKEVSYELLESARYAHGEKYIETLLKACGFRSLAHETANIRTQNHQPLKGILWLAQKP